MPHWVAKFLDKISFLTSGVGISARTGIRETKRMVRFDK